MKKHTFFQNYGFRIIFVVVFLLSFVWMGTRRTLESNSNNVADWLPKTYPETRQYQWFLKHFPFESFVVISWDGCNLGDDSVEVFAQKLVPGQTIDNISDWMVEPHDTLTAELLGTDGKSVEPSKTPPSDATSSLRDKPAAAESSKTPHYFKQVLTGQRLLEMMMQRYGNSDGVVSMTRDEIIERLEGVLIDSKRTDEAGNPIPWEKRQTALIATLSKNAAGKEMQAKELRRVLEYVRQTGRECGVEPPIPADPRSLPVRLAGQFLDVLHEMLFGRDTSQQTQGIIIGGPPVDNVALDVEGERTLIRLAGLCALIGFTLSYICFRSLRLTSFVFWVSILAAGIAMAVVSLTGSRCDAILLSMPALVYVLAMSGAIHIINYYHDAIRENGLTGAAERAIRHAAYPCSIAALTTAFGLFSLYFGQLLPIQKFGAYAAIGVLVSLGLLFLYLPALLHFYPSRDYAKKYGGLGLKSEENTFVLRFWHAYADFIVRWRLFIVGLCIVAMFVGGYGMMQIKTSVKLMRFFSSDAEIITHYTWLETNWGPLVPMEVVIRFDQDAIADQSGRDKPVVTTLERMRLVDHVSNVIREHFRDEIGGVMSAATLAPPLTTNAPTGSARRVAYESALNGQLSKALPSLKDYVCIEGNPSLRKEDNDKYDEIIAQVGLTEDDAVLLRRCGLDSLGKILTVPEGRAWGVIDADTMASYRDKAVAWQKLYGHDLWRISMRTWSLKRDIDYAHFINDLRHVIDPIVADFAKAKNLPPESLTTIYTGVVPVVYKTQHELLRGLQISLIMAFVTISVVMAIVLKSFVAGMIAMIPNVFPIVIVFGFMGMCGFVVDVGTMMTASVALGIAVDDTMHYLTWFREAIDRGLDAKQAAVEAYERCGTAMVQTTLIGGLGLAAFMFSTFTPTQMFGTMMLALLFAALFGDLVFLPAILTGWAGKFFTPVHRPDAEDEDENKA
ncbi:MAG: efflux RND transporter permease subunit [Thermoguttaceae bacterium]